jgi:hypothetical protein
MNKIVALVLGVAAGLVTAGPVWGHHSEAVYDITRLKMVKGTITEHMLVNPHQMIKMRSRAADGSYTSWVLVGANVSSNRSVGWTKETLKPGDEITAWGFAYRDGKPNMTWMRIMTSEGKILPIAGNKNDKLSRFLGTYGKDQLSPEDYEAFKRSINWVETGNRGQ